MGPRCMTSHGPQMAGLLHVTDLDIDIIDDDYDDNDDDDDDDDDDDYYYYYYYKYI